MSFVLVNEGEKEALGRWVNKNTPDDLVLHLYTNDLTPDEDTALGDLTESTGAGYSPVTLTGANWQLFCKTDATTWAADTVYAEDVLVVPTAGGNLFYRAIQGGTSGSSEPTWPTTPGATVVDGGVIWECMQHTLAEYPEVTFAYTGAEAAIYGYYITNNAGTVLHIAERFTDGPYSIPTGGGEVRVTPRIKLD